MMKKAHVTTFIKLVMMFKLVNSRGYQKISKVPGVE